MKRRKVSDRTNIPIGIAPLSWLLPRGTDIFRIFFCLVGDYAQNCEVRLFLHLKKCNFQWWNHPAVLPSTNIEGTPRGCQAHCLVLFLLKLFNPSNNPVKYSL